MFENSLVESSGSVRTRSKWYAVVSFLLEAVALAVMILIPYIYPAALSPHALASPLVAPPPPTAPPPAPTITSQRAHAPVNAPVQLVNLAAPIIIPNQIHEGNNASAPPRTDTGFGEVPGSNAPMLGAPPLLPPSPPRVKASGPSNAVRRPKTH